LGRLLKQSSINCALPFEMSAVHPCLAGLNGNQMLSQEKPVLKYGNIVVSAQGRAEMEGSRIVILVPTAEVNRVVLKYGRPEHCPLFSISVGVLLGLVLSV